MISETIHINIQDTVNLRWDTQNLSTIYCGILKSSLNLKLISQMVLIEKKSSHLSTFINVYEIINLVTSVNLLFARRKINCFQWFHGFSGFLRIINKKQRKKYIFYELTTQKEILQKIIHMQKKKISRLTGKRFQLI